MVPAHDKITVYYDGACPKCIRDRINYEKLAGKAKAAQSVVWFDITGKEDTLRKLGINPSNALTELHVQDENNKIHTEMDAYIILMSRVSLLKPLAWFIALPLIRPLLARFYHWKVNKRLKKDGRLGL